MILIDCDIIVYRCGWAAEKTKWFVDGELRENKKDAKAYIEFLKENFGGEPELTSEVILESLPNTLQMVKSTLNNILEKCAYFGEPKLFLTGEGNFRHDIATIKEYKGNRKDMRKPHWYDEIRTYLVDQWDAEVVNGQEADDAIGIAAWADYQLAPDLSVIVTTDKDLNMIPGMHFDWVKDEQYLINDLDAMKNFYMQVLMGDATDNIPGVKGIGPVKASKVVESCESELQMHTQTYYEYAKDTFPDSVQEFGSLPLELQQLAVVSDRFNEVATLLWIRREEHEMWRPFKYPLGETIE